MARISVLLLASLLVAPTSTRAQETCTLTGRPFQLPISVPAVGDAILVTGHRAEVIVDAERTSARGRVRAPIAFEGTIDPLELFAYARRGHALADGTLRLGAGSNVHLVTDGSVVALLGPGVTATLPTFPCVSLTLTPPPDRARDPARLPIVTHAIDSLVVLPLYASAEADVPSATIRTTEPIEVTVTRSNGDRVLVSTDLGMARVHGWVAASQLTAIEPHEALTRGVGSRGTGLCGRSDHPYSYDGPGRVRVGAIVRGPTGAEWGRVTRSLAVLRIGVRAFDESQVELIRVQGLESRTCGQDLAFDLAVVSLDDVVAH